MKTMMSGRRMDMIRTGAAGLAAALLGPGLAMAEPDLATRLEARKTLSIRSAVAMGSPATDAQGDLYLARLEAKWGGVMRVLKGWEDGSFRQFREGYRNFPVSVFERALAADSFEGMQRAFDEHTVLHAQKTMAKAYPLGTTHAGDLADPRVVEAHRLTAKALGEDAKDLVFIPITPCTVWDTRFASDPNSAGIITNGATKKFFSHFSGAGGSFAPYGGNPSCPETAQNAIGGRPYAVMLTVFTNDATGNGWVTVYRDGDPDPSQATISVYYAAGPTKTQTVISKSSRGYGSGLFDVAATSRFASVHVAAVVTGYFIKPQATALDCVNVTGAGFDVAAGGTRLWGADDVTCTAGYTLTGCGSNWITDPARQPFVEHYYFINGCALDVTNTGSSAVSIVPTARCCRIPGR